MFQSLLLEYNQKFNLTSITDKKDIFYKHFLDSVLGERFFLRGANVAEIGSGAGFPSIPIKIIRPDLNFTLVESTAKKCDFLRIVVEKLGLQNVTILCKRAEEVGKGDLRETFLHCTARAVASLNVLAEYCLPLVKEGGTVIAYKGNVKEELFLAKNAISLLGGGNVTPYSYSLPEGYGERTLLIIKKEKSTPAKYPRGNGKERKNPL